MHENVQNFLRLSVRLPILTKYRPSHAEARQPPPLTINDSFSRTEKGIATLSTGTHLAFSSGPAPSAGLKNTRSIVRPTTPVPSPRPSISAPSGADGVKEGRLPAPTAQRRVSVLARHLHPMAGSRRVEVKPRVPAYRPITPRPNSKIPAPSLAKMISIVAATSD